MPQVYGDPGRLLEVFQNLIDNSTKFMGEQKHPRIEIGAERDNGQVHCFVRDNGLGIAAEYHARVFDLFDRLDTKVDGTGVGLALVKRIVEVHGGRIWIESAGEGQGSSFHFTLPAVGE
jgi:signal transduction histidine kinase